MQEEEKEVKSDRKKMHFFAHAPLLTAAVALAAKGFRRFFHNVAIQNWQHTFVCTAMSSMKIHYKWS
jgi:hypothetical protein